jgi:nitroimidazol reductase NimA-like FMN-containing flavoprotein (pyridoxamine 5'-phosphate oxidase superfamily)
MVMPRRWQENTDLFSHGGSVSPGPGGGTGRVVERLDEAECRRLLGTGRIGHLAYASRYGPMTLPVEYTLRDGSIVFHVTDDTFTEEDLRTGIAHAEYQVAVALDDMDPEAREGWTVLVRGTAHHIDSEAERASITSAGLEPWIEGESEHFIRVIPGHFWGTASAGHDARGVTSPSGSSPGSCSGGRGPAG